MSTIFSRWPHSRKALRSKRSEEFHRCIMHISCTITDQLFSLFSLRLPVVEKRSYVLWCYSTSSHSWSFQIPKHPKNCTHAESVKDTMPLLTSTDSSHLHPHTRKTEVQIVIKFGCCSTLSRKCFVKEKVVECVEQFTTDCHQFTTWHKKDIY